MVKILYFYDDIIAKSDGTSLINHTFDSIKVLDIILKNNHDLLVNRFNLLKKDFDLFEFNLKKSVIFHDFGKATYNWQNKIRNCNNSKLPPHAPYSGYFLSIMGNPQNLIPLLLVSSHHSLLTENSFKNLNINVKYNEKYLIELINEYNSKFGNYVNNELRLEKFDSIVEYFEIMKNFIIQSQHLNHRRIVPLNNELITLFFKFEYALSLSLLTTSDGLSSHFEEVNEKISERKVNDIYPSPNIIFDTINWVSKDKTLTSIQKKIKSINYLNNNDLVKPILLEAPCGEGKTLASLIYAEKLFKNNIINKVIFLLPTQITSNNMFSEFIDEYNVPEKWMGIYHSEVLNFFNSYFHDDEINYSFEKYSNLTYSKPFNISTIDHLLLSLVNGFKFAPRAFGNIVNSLIVIDELHYYDYYTLSLIEVLCKILRILKIPHIIMSATIPSFIKNRFLHGNYATIQSSGCDWNNIEKNPFEFKYFDETLFDEDYLSDTFLNLIDKNIDKNIGIIVNTVPTSKLLFNKLKEKYPDKQILLYNSQFMKKDRPIKEKLIKCFSKAVSNKITEEEKDFLNKYGFTFDENFIFIGTQVAEISLNMSFDVIISELAPLDALIQRGGRLHRTRTYNNNKDCNCLQCKKIDEFFEYIFYVFNSGEYCYPYFTKNDDIESYKATIINNTRKVLINNQKFTFLNSINMMNEVYNENSIDEQILNKMNMDKLNFEEKIKEDLIFGKNPLNSEEENGQTRIQTREINSQSVVVLPIVFKYNGTDISAYEFVDFIFKDNNFKDTLTTKGFNEIVNHMVSVSNNVYHLNKADSIILSNKTIKVINQEYSFERGLFDDEALL